MQDLLTTTEAAERLGIDKRSVVKAINRGKLRAAKRGRDYLLEASEVDRYAAEHLRSAVRSVADGGTRPTDAEHGASKE
jgi:excisionase family DNA binding protein